MLAMLAMLAMHESMATVAGVPTILTMFDDNNDVWDPGPTAGAERGCATVGVDRRCT